jgi:hypothetical protein
MTTPHTLPSTLSPHIVSFLAFLHGLRFNVRCAVASPESGPLHAVASPESYPYLVAPDSSESLNAVPDSDHGKEKRKMGCHGKVKRKNRSKRGMHACHHVSHRSTMQLHAKNPKRKKYCNGRIQTEDLQLTGALGRVALACKLRPDCWL